MDTRIEEVKHFTMKGTVFISEIFPIDTSSSFNVRFKARSLNPNILSWGYFLIDCLNEEQKSISCQDVYVMSKIPPVTVIGISADRTTLAIEEDDTDWGLAEMTYKYIGVYSDGDTERLPTLSTS